MSGWKFDDLRITVWKRLCEALYAAGLEKDSIEDLLEMTNTFDKEIYTSEPMTKWVSGVSMPYPFVFRAFETSLQSLPNNVSPLPKAAAT